MDYCSDEQLIGQYLKGDEKSLELLIARYLKSIYSFAYKYAGNSQDAEDIAQTTFIKAWKHLKRFDQNKSFKTWIFTIAKRVCIDFIKKKKTIPLSVFDDEEGENAVINGLTDPSPLAEEISERRDLASKISFAIEQLMPKYRTVLSLYYNEHYNFREIAEMSEESVNTVKSRHRRALGLLRKLLGDNMEF